MSETLEEKLHAQASIMLLAIHSLSDSLWKASQMEHEDIALQCLESGAASAREILR